MSSMLNALKLLEERKRRQLTPTSAPIADTDALSSDQSDVGRAISTPEPVDAAAPLATQSDDDIAISAEARVTETLDQVEKLNVAVERELVDESLQLSSEPGDGADEHLPYDPSNDQPLTDEAANDHTTSKEPAPVDPEAVESFHDEQMAEETDFSDSFSEAEANHDRAENNVYQTPAIEVGLSRADDVYDGTSPIDDEEITVYGGIDPGLFDTEPVRTNVDAQLPSMLGNNQEYLQDELEFDKPTVVDSEESFVSHEERSAFIDDRNVSKANQPSDVGEPSEHESKVDVEDATAGTQEAEAHVEARLDSPTESTNVAAPTAEEPDVGQTMVINSGDLTASLGEPPRRSETGSTVPGSATDASVETAPATKLLDSNIPTLRLNADATGGVAAAWPAEGSTGRDAFAAFSSQMTRIEQDGNVTRPAPPVIEPAPGTNESVADDQADSPFPTSFATVFKTMDPGNRLASSGEAPSAPSVTRPMAVPFDFFGGGTETLASENLSANEQTDKSIHRIAQAHQSQSGAPDENAEPAHSGQLEDERTPQEPAQSGQLDAPEAADSPSPTGTPFVPQIKKENSTRPNGKSPVEAARASFQPDRISFLDSIRQHMKGRRLITEYHTVWNSIRQSSSGGVMKGNIMFLDCETDRPAAHTLIYTAATPRENDVRSVMLVDADMQMGRLSSILSLDKAPGFSELSLGADLDGLVQEIDLPHTHLLPAGKNRDAVDPDGIEAMMAELTELYDFVLVAGGLSDNPLVPVINRACGNSFLVVRLGTSDRSAAIDAVNSLNNVGVNLGGCVVANIEADHTNF